MVRRRGTGDAISECDRVAGKHLSALKKADVGRVASSDRSGRERLNDDRASHRAETEGEEDRPLLVS